MNTSMVNYDTAGAAGTAETAGAAGEQRREIDYHGVSLSVPEKFWDAGHGGVNMPALLKAAEDLRRKVSDMGAAPETYLIRLPDDLADGREVAADDPLTQAAMVWAKKHRLSQEAFDELVETFVRQEAETLDPDHFREMQMAALKEELGPACDEVCKDIGHWFGAMMRDDFEARPELRDAAEELASDARGVMLLKAVRERLSERGVPGREQTASGAMDEAALRRLQTSDAYVNARHPEHMATVRRVRDGWQKLVGRD